MLKTCTSVALVLFAAGSAMAGPVFHGVDSSGTSTSVFGGDRQLNTLAFAGAPSFSGANFGHWADGKLWNYKNGVAQGPFGWNDPIDRDVNTSGNVYSGNPDRVDGSSAFALEGSGQGTLNEVFGTSTFGYKNMSWIMDGEKPDGGPESFVLDLYFAPGNVLNADADDDTVELAILERGGNSDIRVYGITAGDALTAPLLVDRSYMTEAGWSIDTLEIGDSQKVHGVGISFDSAWQGLIGVRLEMDSGFDGPDIVAVGSGTPVPTPGTGILTAAAGLIVLRRRRR